MADKIREACRAEDKPDILILARGGGAEDDLSPFNDRILWMLFMKVLFP